MNDLRRAPRRSHSGLILAVLCASSLLGMGGWIAWKDWSRGASNERLALPTKELATQVSAWGRLAPQSDVIPLSAAANQFVACVEELLVGEGDSIHEGQPIAILDTHARRKAAVEEAEARVQMAKAKLATVQAGAKPESIAAQQALIDVSQAELDESQQQYERGKNLAATQSIADEEQATRWTRWKKATASLLQAQRQLAALKNPQAEEVAVAKAEVAFAESSLVVAKADLEQSIIRSPIVGQVLRVNARQGQKIGEAGVVDIGDTRRMHAIAEVYEEDIGRIRLHQPAEVFIPSLQTTLKGRVERISLIVARKSVFNNDPVEDTDARVVEVRIALDEADSQRVSGLSNARIHARVFVETAGDDKGKPEESTHLSPAEDSTKAESRR